MVHVQFGCGFSTGEDWRNFDNSPTLRIERLPLIGGVLGSFAGNSMKFPRAVEYGDICSKRGLPVEKGTVSGLYASHVLEHLALDDFGVALQRSFEMLRPGGEFRLIVPDLQERARRYIDAVEGGDMDANSEFMVSAHLGQKTRTRGMIGSFRSAWGGSRHLWMWDEVSMRKRLEETGFERVRRCKFGDSDDEKFSQVEEEGRFIDKGRSINELAMSAFKPE